MLMVSFLIPFYIVNIMFYRVYFLVAKILIITLGQGHIIRDVTKVKNIRIRRMRIITLLFVKYWMRIVNTKFQYIFSVFIIFCHFIHTSKQWKQKSTVNLICLIYDLDRKHLALHCIWNERPRTSCTHAAPVVILSDKWEIFRLFAFERKASNYSTNIEYARSVQYSNVVEFEFGLRHNPTHNLVLTAKSLSITDRDFITSMIFKGWQCNMFCYYLKLYILFLSHASYVLILLCLVAVCQLELKSWLIDWFDYSH